MCVCPSSQKERDSLEPGRAVYYTWAEPTGSRQLKWTCGPYSGELKSEEVRGGEERHQERDKGRRDTRRERRGGERGGERREEER